VAEEVVMRALLLERRPQERGQLRGAPREVAGVAVEEEQEKEEREEARRRRQRRRRLQLLRRKRREQRLQLQLLRLPLERLGLALPRLLHPRALRCAYSLHMLELT
jgi:hypothetical protein